MTAAVGFIGLGQIGAPMAMRLIGWPGGLFVHDVATAATDKLADAGATSLSSPAEVARHATLISVMVRDDEQVRSVVAGLLADARPGTVVAVHSTIRGETARELAATAAHHDVHVIDAPVSGGAIGAQAGRLAIMVGGTDDAFAAAQDYLVRMADLVVHVGPVGAGTAAKLARNLVHFVAFTAAGEALRLAEAAQLDLRTLGAIVRHTDAITGGPGAIMLRESTAGIASDDPWRPILDNVRTLGEKDLALALDLAAGLGVDLPLARTALARLGIELGLDDKET